MASDVRKWLEQHQLLEPDAGDPDELYADLLAMEHALHRLRKAPNKRMRDAAIYALGIILSRTKGVYCQRNAARM